MSARPADHQEQLPATPGTLVELTGPAVLALVGWAFIGGSLWAAGGPMTVGVVAGAGLLSLSALLLAFRLRRYAQELEHARKLQAHHARTDPLTGMLNHSAFMSALDRDFALAQRYRQALTVMMLDIDFFKRINDGYGHAVGDHALRSFSVALADGLRNVDAVGRVGGPKFAILLPGTSSEAALRLAERLRERVAGIVVQTAHDEEVRFTTSVGVAEIHAEDPSSEKFLDRAAQALLSAKANGRNRVEASPGA